MSNFRLKMAKNSFLKGRADFYTDLAAALRDKSDLVSEISNLLKRAEQRKDLGKIIMFNEWLNHLDRGMLTEAMVDTLPKTDLMILKAFEVSGKLPDGLDFLSKTVKLAAKMKSTIIGAIAGPAIIFLFIMAILALHAFMLTPIMIEIYEVEEWPFLGQMLYPLSQLVKHYGIYLLVGVAALVAAFIFSINKWTGEKRKFLDDFLPYSIFRDYNGALFLTSLAAMMKSGTGVMESLRSLEVLSTDWMKWHIQTMTGRLAQYSDQPAMALDTGAIPRQIMDRIIDYGKRSSFLDAMTMIGLDSMQKTQENLSKSASKINIIMLLIAGGLFMLIISGTMLTGQHASDVLRARMNV